RHHLTADQTLDRIVLRDLRRGPFHADLRPEIDAQFERGLARFGEGFGLDDPAHPDIDLCKVVIADLFGHIRAHLPNSRPRSAAAFTARCKSAGNPVSGSISTARAAAVVPPGEVTLTRSCSALSPDRCASSPAPVTVARASFIAIPGERPSASPAAASASIRWKT